LEFVKTAFDAVEYERLTRSDGTVGHAEVRIADSVLMVGEAPGDRKAMPCAIDSYVADCDMTYRRALQAGGKSVSEPVTQFYGDRHAGVEGPCGDLWWIATRVENLSGDELRRRAEQFVNKPSALT